MVVVVGAQKDSFVANKGGVFMSFCPVGSEDVKNSSLMLQIERWKSWKKEALWRREAFQANCDSSSCIVYQHIVLCLYTSCQWKRSPLGSRGLNDLCPKITF